jgi:hypothetical protein
MSEKSHPLLLYYYTIMSIKLLLLLHGSNLIFQPDSRADNFSTAILNYSLISVLE